MSPQETEKYFNKPLFNWFFDWQFLLHMPTNDEWNSPITIILWKSKKTGRIVQKVYHYQINNI
jgi:hypothetical protein